MPITTWTTEEIIFAVNGKILIGNSYKIFKRINIDSRTVIPGDLFVAINGENHKGIHFLDEAIQKGALGILIEEIDIKEFDLIKNNIKNISCIVVKSTVNALGNLANYHRKRLNIKVVGITGSVGKTTTRQMISRISAQKYSTASTKGNMNNHIGLPLTLLKVDNHHDIVVLELGMSNLGEIKRLSQICQPDIGVITNIAPVHLATLGNINNILIAKSEIIQHIQPKGSIVLNADDSLVRTISKITTLNVLFFGTKNEADIRGSLISVTNKGVKFLLKTFSGSTTIEISNSSMSLLNNALAASAVGVLLGCTNNEIRKGIESFKPTCGRMKNIKTQTSGVEIIDDTYNSNPVSLKSALETLRLLKKDRSTIAIIGDMLELGKESKSMHHKAGKLIAQTGVNKLYAVGNFAKDLVEGAKSAKMTKEQTNIGNQQNIINDIKQHITTDCVILVKGSRGMHMEKIVASIIEIFNKENPC